MNIFEKISSKFQTRLAEGGISKLFQKENKVGDIEGSIRFSGDSPSRFNIPMEIQKYTEKGRPGFIRTAPTMLSNILNLNKVLDSLKDNPENPKTKIRNYELEEFEKYARKVGADLIGYTKIDSKLIFKDKAVLHENVIVLGLEMSKKRIDTVPSFLGFKEVMQTYNKLGITVNKIARYFRKKGFSAHAGHPLMGASLYPPLAQAAGLAWIGYSGIMISPQFGPRFRLAAVYVNIENLPNSEENEHSWVREYCDTCKICIKECPGNAILDQAKEHEDGRITHIDNQKCMPYFSNNYGCSICIRVCPFNNVDYYTLKKDHRKENK